MPVLPLVRLLAAITFVSCLAASVARAAVLTSSDGETREFPVIMSATPDGLTVRKAPTGRDIVIPWTRLDAGKTAQANPWFEAARQQAAAGGTVKLNLGLPQSNPLATPTEPAAPILPEWRSVKSSVAGGKGENFTQLTLSAYVHREVAVPRLAVVWIGSPSPLATRGDAADFARRMHGALVVAEFEGPYLQAGDGSGQALVTGVANLLRQARTDGTAETAPSGLGASSSRMKDPPAGDAPPAAETDAGKTTGPAATGGDGFFAPALVVMGRGEAASFVWSLLCSRPQDVLVAITLDGVHSGESNAGAFATPCLFMETPAAAVTTGAPATAVDLTRPHALWRHYSTDGCRWCFAAPTGDPLALAVAFARAVAAASPYVEALEMRESWHSNKLRHRIPMPVLTPKNFKEDAFRLATPDGASVFPVSAKTGAARNDLVWVPSAAIAARLAGK